MANNQESASLATPLLLSSCALTSAVGLVQVIAGSVIDVEPLKQIDVDVCSCSQAAHWCWRAIAWELSCAGLLQVHAIKFSVLSHPACCYH
eukprot:6491140-Amphidinium_carterae.2